MPIGNRFAFCFQVALEPFLYGNLLYLLFFQRIVPWRRNWNIFSPQIHSEGRFIFLKSLLMDWIKLSPYFDLSLQRLNFDLFLKSHLFLFWFLSRLRWLICGLAIDRVRIISIWKTDRCLIINRSLLRLWESNKSRPLWCFAHCMLSYNRPSINDALVSSSFYLSFFDIVLVIFLPKTILSSCMHLFLVLSWWVKVELLIEISNLLVSKSVIIIRALTINLFQIRFSEATKGNLCWTSSNDIECFHVNVSLNFNVLWVRVKEFLTNSEVLYNHAFNRPLSLSEPLDWFESLIKYFFILLRELGPSRDLGSDRPPITLFEAIQCFRYSLSYRYSLRLVLKG